jgi:hypothetical protein
MPPGPSEPQSIPITRNKSISGRPIFEEILLENILNISISEKISKTTERLSISRLLS